MIKFLGIKRVNDVAFLKCANDLGATVEIPLEMAIADRISMYLQKISMPPPQMIHTDEEQDADALGS